MYTLDASLNSFALPFLATNNAFYVQNREANWDVRFTPQSSRWECIMKHGAGSYAKYNDRGEAADHIEYEASTVFICLPPTHPHTHTLTHLWCTCMVKYTLKTRQKHTHTHEVSHSHTAEEQMYTARMHAGRFSVVEFSCTHAVKHTNTHTYADTSTGQRVPVA